MGKRAYDKQNISVQRRNFFQVEVVERGRSCLDEAGEGGHGGSGIGKGGLGLSLGRH